MLNIYKSFVSERTRGECRQEFCECVLDSAEAESLCLSESRGSGSNAAGSAAQALCEVSPCVAGSHCLTLRCISGSFLTR